MKNEKVQLIDNFLKEIRKTEFFSRVEFIILFGSCITNYALKDSDIDLCLYISGENKNLAKIRINLLTRFDDKFDIQIFQLLPLYVQIEVLKGRVLYTRDENFLYKIAQDIIEEYEEFYPFYLDYINR